MATRKASEKSHDSSCIHWMQGLWSYPRQSHEHGKIHCVPDHLLQNQLYIPRPDTHESRSPQTIRECVGRGVMKRRHRNGTSMSSYFGRMCVSFFSKYMGEILESILNAGLRHLATHSAEEGTEENPFAHTPESNLRVGLKAMAVITTVSQKRGLAATPTYILIDWIFNITSTNMCTRTHNWEIVIQSSKYPSWHYFAMSRLDSSISDFQDQSQSPHSPHFYRFPFLRFYIWFQYQRFRIRGEKASYFASTPHKILHQYRLPSTSRLLPGLASISTRRVNPDVCHKYWKEIYITPIPGKIIDFLCCDFSQKHSSISLPLCQFDCSIISTQFKYDRTQLCHKYWQKISYNSLSYSIRQPYVSDQYSCRTLV